MKPKPAHYREQAERSRELARKSRDQDIASHLLQVAEQYDRLAEEAEAG